MNLLSALKMQTQVVHALILRETRTRFGANQLGFLWAFIEPALFVATFYAVFALSDRSAPSGMSLFGFMVTGVVPYLLFKEASGRTSVAISSNRGLLFYPQVRPLDLIVARGLLEWATSILILVVLMGGEALVMGSGDVQAPLGVFIGLTLAGGIGCFFGAILGSFSLYAPSVERFSGPLMRPLFWLSGVFYAANDVPPALLDIIKYNPILHCVEMVRGGWFHAYEPMHVVPLFPIGTLLGLSLFALLLERASRTRIQLT